MTPISTRRSSPRGFTLLEILICLALIAIAFLAVTRLSAQNLDLQAEARFVTIATYLLQNRLSQIQSREELEPGFFSGTFEKSFPYFHYQEEIEEVTEKEGLFKVTVRIILEKRVPAEGLSIETFMYRKAP